MEVNKDAFYRVVTRVNFSPSSILQLKATILDRENPAVVAARFGISSTTLSNKTAKFNLELQKAKCESLAKRISADPDIRDRFLKDRYG